MSTLKEGSKDWWDAKYKATSSYLYSKEPSSFLMKHSELLPSKAQVVDLACGEGRNAVALAAKGHQVLGIDFSEVALERAQGLASSSNVEVKWKKQDLDFFIPDLMAYDLIFCSYFVPPATIFKNLFRGLKKGGLIIFENYLIQACKEKKDLEVFETFKPGQLLKEMGSGMNFQVRFYSEYGNEFENDRVYYIAQKTEMM